MNGVAYKDIIAGKSSELYKAITEGRDADAKRIYAETTARSYALLHGLKVPKVVIGTEGKSKCVWAIVSDDAVYDNNGRFKELK